MKVKDFIKKLDGLKDELKEKDIVVRVKNGHLVSPLISFETSYKKPDSCEPDFSDEGIIAVVIYGRE